jgi:hypothetical protein
MIDAKSITIPEGAVARILVGDDVIWKTRKIITTEDMLVKNTGAKLIEKWNLTPNSANGSSNSEYFTFKEIPIEPGATYYSYCATRSWFLDADKNPLKTLNPTSMSGTGSNVKFEFVAPSTACYISISYSYASAGSPDNVYIRKEVQSDG